MKFPRPVEIPGAAASPRNPLSRCEGRQTLTGLRPDGGVRPPAGQTALPGRRPRSPPVRSGHPPSGRGAGLPPPPSQSRVRSLGGEGPAAGCSPPFPEHEHVAESNADRGLRPPTGAIAPEPPPGAGGL